MDIRKGAEELVNVYLDLEDRHCGLHFVEKTGGSVHSLRDKFKNEVEVDFFLLREALASSFMAL